MDEEDIAQKITEQLKEKGINTDVKLEQSDAEEDQKEESPVEEAEVLGHADLNPSSMDEPVLEPESKSNAEDEALSKGWKPDGPKSAEEFLRAEPLYEEIKRRGKEAKELKAQLAELTRHVAGLKKAGYESKIDQMQDQRQQAIVRSDIDSVDYYDNELQKLKTEMQTDVEIQQLHPAAQEFLERHKELQSDYSLEAQEIKSFISQRDKELFTYSLDPYVHIQTLEKDLQKKFPERYKRSAPETQSVSAVESDAAPVASRSKKGQFAYSDLTRDQKQVCQRLVKRGVMTKEAYIKQIAEINEQEKSVQ